MFSEKPCALYCTPVGRDAPMLMAERVLDGTPCGPYESDLCVHGRCQVLYFLLYFFFIFIMHNFIIYNFTKYLLKYMVNYEHCQHAILALVLLPVPTGTVAISFPKLVQN